MATLSESDFSSIVVLRALSMLLSFGANILSIRIVTERYGVDGFTLYSFLVGIVVLFPFADLGLGAAIVNLTADWRAGKTSVLEWRRSTRRVVKILVVGASALIVVAVVVTFFATWHFLLGSLFVLPQANNAVLVIFALTFVTIPTGVGARVLQGLTLTKTTVQWGLIGGPLQAGLLLLAASVDSLPYAYYPVAVVLAIVIMNGCICWSAIRRTRRVPDTWNDPSPAERHSLKDMMAVSVPYFVVIVTAVVFLQSDRFILIHVSGEAAVAEFSLVAQFVAPVIAMLGLISQNLWPQFRGLSGDQAALVDRLKRSNSLYLVTGIVLAVVLPPLGVIFAPVLVGDEIRASLPVLISASAFILLFSVLRPVTMLLNSSRGMTVQAVTGIVACLVNVVLTAVLSSRLGATGAYLSSTAALAICQYVPLTFYARRQIAHAEALR